MKIHYVIWSKKIAQNKALQVSTKTSLSHSFKPSESSGVVRGNFTYFPAFYFPWSVKLVKFSFWTTKIKYLTRQPGQVKRIHIRGKKKYSKISLNIFFPREGLISWVTRKLYRLLTHTNTEHLRLSDLFEVWKLKWTFLSVSISSAINSKLYYIVRQYPYHS